MFIMLPIMLQAVATPPPPPTLQTARVPPPVFNPYPVAAEAEKGPAVPIKVTLYLGRETLWSGTLSVGAVPAPFMLIARYSRPAQDGLCPAGVRSVSVEQLVSLDAGKVTLQGDGGFQVVLTK